MKIKVKYRNEWYYASDIHIDKEGNIFFEYLYGLDGCVDLQHIKEYIIEDLK